MKYYLLLLIPFLVSAYDGLDVDLYTQESTLALTGICSSTPSFDDPNRFEDCGKHEGSVSLSHIKATGYLDRTNEKLGSSRTPASVSGDETVYNAFKKYFKIDLNDPKQADLAKKVMQNVSRINSSKHKTKYRCRAEDNSLWCLTGPVGIVPPPKNYVYLCKPWFRVSRPESQQTGVLLHEMFHMHGGSHIDYLPEDYCSEAPTLAPKDLVRMADQYMLFVHYIANGGSELKCF